MREKAQELAERAEELRLKKLKYRTRLVNTWLIIGLFTAFTFALGMVAGHNALSDAVLCPKPSSLCSILRVRAWKAYLPDTHPSHRRPNK